MMTRLNELANYAQEKAKQNGLQISYADVMGDYVYEKATKIYYNALEVIAEYIL